MSEASRDKQQHPHGELPVSPAAPSAAHPETHPAAHPETRPAAPPAADPSAPPSLSDTLILNTQTARTTEDIFVGTPMHTPYGRAFGGNILGQAIIAAGRTVSANQDIHSLHAYFLRPGNVTDPLTYAVDRLHDGRSFATRRTQAFQGGVPILSMISSFQTPDTGIDHQAAIDMDAYPEPEQLPSLAERYGHLAREHGHMAWVLERPCDIRHVTEPIFVRVSGELTATQAEWIRVPERLPDDAHVHRAALAFMCDYSLLEPIYRRHGVPWATPGLRSASLDYALWFHRPFRADEWLLCVSESPSAQGGRGLGMGRVYTRDGVLVASTAQEGMVRVPKAQLD